ncbi:MAG: AmmeMemoRadiSam system protein B [Puniceicoccales bacterium]|jgi:AmmeMemoRadiSam system protein B/AmmeMemoRadiSam system protein A|nr:AmmeMemoRadiSam system protein B [Puniceicoccales bacterium]
MFTLKEADVAGVFYQKEPKALLAEVLGLKKSIERQYECSSRAVIAPHAGYIYSGKLAASALQYLGKGTKNIFIFSPAHRIAFDGMAICDYSGFKTPLGEVPVNNTVNGELLKNFGCKLFDGAFDGEHAVEVQLPILQTHLEGIKIVPIIVGNTRCDDVAKIIEKFWADRSNSFVISSDLSHFHGYEEAIELDSATHNAIENCTIENFSPECACGATSIRGLVNFAAKSDFSLIRIGAYNSGEVSGDKSRVVGYGAWMLVESSKNQFIKEHFAGNIISICRKSIETALKRVNNFMPANVPEVLKQLGASFVTLEIDGNLRGCIGSIHAYQPLIADLIQNARNAAFGDTRFPPLTAEEFKKITINVSLLSHPQKIKFENEGGLLDAIVPNVDGVIIRDGIFQAVYLPCVWEQLPDKKEFLMSLKLKAGLPRNHFSKTFEAFKFSSEYFREADL